jgi:hypothetical protein
MATFAKFVTACETAFWPEGTFLAAYGVNADNAVDDVLEADVGVSTFRDFMAERGAFEGTATELLAALTERVRKPEREAAERHRRAIADRDHDLQVLTAMKLREAQQAVRDVMSSGWPKKPQVLAHGSRRSARNCAKSVSRSPGPLVAARGARFLCRHIVEGLEQTRPLRPPRPQSRISDHPTIMKTMA